MQSESFDNGRRMTELHRLCFPMRPMQRNYSLRSTWLLHILDNLMPGFDQLARPSISIQDQHRPTKKLRPMALAFAFPFGFFLGDGHACSAAGVYDNHRPACAQPEVREFK